MRLGNAIPATVQRTISQHEWPLIRTFLAELDDLYTGEDSRDFLALQPVLCEELDYRRINEVVDGAAKAGIPGGEWLFKQIQEAGTKITRGKSNALFNHMDERAQQIKSAAAA
jgi:hypothetical protein